MKTDKRLHDLVARDDEKIIPLEMTFPLYTCKTSSNLFAPLQEKVICLKTRSSNTRFYVSNKIYTQLIKSDF